MGQMAAIVHARLSPGPDDPGDGYVRQSPPPNKYVPSQQIRDAFRDIPARMRHCRVRPAGVAPPVPGYH